jgi:hypothetical protein
MTQHYEYRIEQSFGMGQVVVFSKPIALEHMIGQTNEELVIRGFHGLMLHFS